MRVAVFLAIIFVAVEARQVKISAVSTVKKSTENIRIEEAMEKKDIFDITKDIKGLVHGDVVPNKSKNTKNTVRDETRHWPGTVIPFKYAINILSLEAIGSIELARQEYRLRTCLDFVEADEETTNYISFQSLNGCYSSVGMVADVGPQTISIGSGCESMAIVCHEMMHAIGIWHEQSRADRDDYVQIMWDVIEPGFEINFYKSDWETTDARGVAYDYNSIMHYADTAYSTTGDPTIVALDPAFQDIIGQGSTFSKGDSEKINKMYECNDTLLVSYNCNYDDEAACGYVQDFETDDINWVRYEVGDKSIPISSMAPTTDATLGISGKGSYMSLDTSAKTAGDVGEMRSMKFVSRNDYQCLQFSYYLDRDDSSTAAFSAYLTTIDEITGEILEYNDPIVTFDGDYGSKWQVYRMTLNAPSAYRLVFRGKTGGNSEDVIAIDDVSVQDKPCEDDYFVVEDYSETLNSFVKGESFVSPVLSSNLGYKYRLQIYPAGTSSSAAGHMGVFFGLVQGPNDDELAWPFCNKYVHMMIVDQSDDPLYSLNKYAGYLTTQDAGGDLWNKPNDTEEPAGYFGYSNFMQISDLTDTHHYLKHDSMMMSVLIKDMNWLDGGQCSRDFTSSTGNSAVKSVDEIYFIIYSLVPIYCLLFFA